MAKILVLSDYAMVDLGEQDEDGDYQWTCAACRESGEHYRPLDEAVAEAEIHADLTCALVVLP